METERARPEDDEIDLAQLVNLLIDGWQLIVGAIVAALVLAGVYLMMTTPQYEATFRASPAAASNFSGMNLLSGFSVSPQDAYTTLGNRLSSFQNFERYVENHRDDFAISDEAALAGVFANRFEIAGLTSDVSGSTELSLTYRYPEGEAGNENLNGYIDATAERVWEELKNRFARANQAQIASLNTRVDVGEDKLIAEREHRLFALNNAINTAHALGIESPTTPQEFGQLNPEREIIYASLSGNGALPLYFMGYKTLEAERKTLKDQMREGLSNGALRNTREELNRRAQIAAMLNKDSFYPLEEGVSNYPDERVVNVIERAYPANNPVKPRTTLVLALAIVLGGMLGVMAVFLRAGMGAVLRQRRAA
ncbi:LPS O-antigen chain length determinant protein WzzB [Chromohalobacter nigrandesensis]|uniref:LPS O-antigen chain length determinant protein WzzB n=1 Tax=Chromohalobacter nigrandesensis TaxID=119863 RepID=UPI001FF19D8E|nr:Wzz/FepE/Etk N-terminal domain-containing protein [Chromohalobacter nigrandesensis]MCK0743696.1 Wzz/FepE/Etk N-terminal domain-containing protein [Chromohalobacter nigrandesensis]